MYVIGITNGYATFVTYAPWLMREQSIITPFTFVYTIFGIHFYHAQEFSSKYDVTVSSILKNESFSALNAAIIIKIQQFGIS